MNYGLPYMGSKNLIAKKLIDALPAATTFVDLFAGGCAMTHAAMLSSSDVDRLLGTNGMAGHYFGRSQWEFPTRENYDIMRTAMPALKDFDEVLAIPHRSRLSGTANNAVVERLYCNHNRQRFGQLDFLGQLFAEAV